MRTQMVADKNNTWLRRSPLRWRAEYLLRKNTAKLVVFMSRWVEFMAKIWAYATTQQSLYKKLRSQSVRSTTERWIRYDFSPVNLCRLFSTRSSATAKIPERDKGSYTP